MAPLRATKARYPSLPSATTIGAGHDVVGSGSGLSVAKLFSRRGHPIESAWPVNLSEHTEPSALMNSTPEHPEMSNFGGDAGGGVDDGGDGDAGDGGGGDDEGGGEGGGGW